MSAVLETKPAFDFTTDWFQSHVKMWGPLHADIVRQHQKFLEIGSFEGQSACWMLQNSLAKDGELFCVDTWEGSPEIDQKSVEASFDRFKKNTAIAKKEGQRLTFYRRRSIDALANLIQFGHAGTFDFIYVDGGHTAIDAMTDAVLAWELLKVGGVLVFDDYMFGMENVYPFELKPKFAIDSFVAAFNSQIKTIAIGLQYIVQKL